MFFEGADQDRIAKIFKAWDDFFDEFKDHALKSGYDEKRGDYTRMKNFFKDFKSMAVEEKISELLKDFPIGKLR